MSATDLAAPSAHTIHTVAVIGAGRKGQAFALRCVEAGFSVVLQDVLASRLRAAQDQAGHAGTPGAGRLATVVEVEDAVREADVAIDFVPDELESKLEIFSLLDRMAPPRTILCTPTALSISDLASCTYRADRCVALEPFEALPPHFFLRSGAATSELSAAAVSTWLQRLGVTVECSAEPQASGLSVPR